MSRVGYAAVDLGGSSGRVVLGLVGADAVEIIEVHRFGNEPVAHDGSLHWDLPELFAQTVIGLRMCVGQCREAGARFGGIGVDSWGVDWGYLRTDGVVELPVRHYRGSPDPAEVIAARSQSAPEAYAISGIVDDPINSGLRMSADARERAFAGEVPLFVPDIWVYWLTGVAGTDPTIASTSGLLDALTREFSPDLVAGLGLSGLRMPSVAGVGDLAGHTTPEITAALGASAPIPVYRVAGHDTESAFTFADPADPGRELLISSGTWSLVCVALDEPCLTEAAREANLSNEAGASGTLLLRNLTGLWMLQECAAAWTLTSGQTLEAILEEAEHLPVDARVIDAGDPRLVAAGDMESRVRQLCQEVGRPLDPTPASVARAILDSLAVAYATTARTIARVTGVEFDAVRLVGGGSRNTTMCERVAALTGLPVLAGPSEATAIGNLAVQAWADGTTASIAALYDRLGLDERPRLINPPVPEGHPS